MPRRRRPRPARLESDRVGSLRFQFISIYGDDEEFKQEVAQFEEEQHGELRALLASRRDLSQINDVRAQDGDDARVADAYLQDLKQLAERFGLDRLVAPDQAPDDGFRPSEGEQRLHRWCHRSAQSRLAGDGPRVPAEFVFVDGFHWPVHDFGPTWSTTAPPSSPRPSTDRVESVDESGRPIVHVVIKSFWEPRSEAPLHVKNRLMAMAEDQIDLQIERIARHAEETGLDFTTYPTARRDLAWLFLKTRHRWSYGDIAARWTHDVTATTVAASLHLKMPVTGLSPRGYQDRTLVQKAVLRMADLIGISRAGW